MLRMQAGGPADCGIEPARFAEALVFKWFQGYSFGCCPRGFPTAADNIGTPCHIVNYPFYISLAVRTLVKSPIAIATQQALRLS